MNPYIQDILAQPDAIRNTVKGLSSADPLTSIANRLANGKWRAVVLTGMGGSYSALYPLLYHLIAQGIQATLIETSELVHHAPGLIRQDALMLVVSQSGRSAETLQLLERARGKTTIVGVTNTPDSPLAQQSDAVVMMQAGQEFTVSCKTYVATLAALAWLADALTGVSPQETMDSLDTGADAVKSYVSQWQEHRAWLVEQLQGVRQLYYVGRGASLAAVGTAALITKEAAHFYADGMSSAAFRHGPLEIVSKEQLVVVYTGSEPTIDLNLRLAQDIRALGGQAHIVGEHNYAEFGAFRLADAAEVVRPILEILPAQMLTLALAHISGHEAGQFRYAQKITMTE